MYPQRTGYIVRHLTIENGLSQNFIYSMIQDKDGFLWFGTADGLNRYDGYQFKVYKYDPDDIHSIADNSILSLLEDSKGNLWIGTGKGGLDRLDPETERISHFRSPWGNTEESVGSINALVEGSNGQLWVGTTKGAWRLNPETGAWISFKPVGNRSITTLLVDHLGGLWIGTEQGLYRKAPDSESLQNFTIGPNGISPLYSDYLRSLEEDSSGYIWIGTSEGLNRYDPVTGLISKLSITKYGKEPEVLSILKSADNRLWVGTSWQGLYLYDPETENWMNIPQDKKEGRGLTPSGAYTLVEDRDGLLWVGTRGVGIAVLNPHQSFQYYPMLSDDPTSMHDPSVRAIYLDRDSVLWVGGYDGLWAFDQHTGKEKHYYYDPDNPQGLPNPFVYSLAEDETGTLWVGTEGYGLARFDRKNETFRSYPSDDNNPSSLPGVFVFVLKFTANGDLWVGTEKGLSRLTKNERESGRFQNYTPENSGLPGPSISCIVTDPFGTLWVGTATSGLAIYNPKTDRFRVIQHNSTRSNSLSDDRVLCLLPTDKGTMWIGTGGGDLDRLDFSDLNILNPENTKFHHYGKNEGLTNDFVYGVLEDDSGILWLSTNDGIKRFDPQTVAFTNYPRIEGQQSREYNKGAWHKSWNGELFFGGINGLNSFFPDKVHDYSVPPPIAITGIQLTNEALVPGKMMPEGVVINKSVNRISSLDLTYKALAITFEFSALSFLDPLGNKYQYRLQGLFNKWLDVPSSRHSITLTHLPSGTFNLEIRAANATGTWNTTGKSIALKMKPAPWQTWWAILIYISFAGAVVLLFIRIRLSQSKKRTEELEKEVAERTTEIRAREDKLRDQNLFLESVLESLSYPFYVIDIRNYKLIMANTAAKEWGTSDADTCYALKAGLEKPCMDENCPLRNIDQYREHHIKREVVKNSGGVEKHIEIHSHPIFDSNGEIKQVIEYYIDVTDRIQLELKLKKNLEARNRELTSQALKMAKDHEVVMDVVNQLNHLDKQTPGSSGSLIRGIESSLKSLVSPGNEWNEFETWFREVHKNFFKRLMDQVPDLSTREQKICAFLKLKLNTKEIASLTNLSVKSVEVYRSRLRGRLGVPTGENLVQFINNI